MISKHLSGVVTRLLYGPFYSNNAFFPRVSRHDIYLVSFPRSGNTWLRCLLTTLITGKAVSPEIVQATIPDVYKSRNQQLPKPTHHPLIIKTHSPYIRIPAKVIYLVRDGRDALISYYHYSQQSHDMNVHLSLSDFFLNESLWPASWHVHTNGWLNGLAQWNPARYLMIHYEDLVASPAEYLEKIARFADLPVHSSHIEHALLLNTREQLRDIEEKAGKGTLNNIGAGTYHTGDALTPGDWNTYYRLAGPTLERLGYL